MIICFIFTTCRIQNTCTVESNGTIHYTINSRGHILVNDFVFDTGSTTSILLDHDSSILLQSTKIGKVKLNRLHKEDYHIISHLKLGEVDLNNFQFINMNESRSSSTFRGYFKKGILGMNVISKTNWIIDNSNKTIETTFDSSNILLNNYISLKYDRTDRPYTSLNVNGREIKKLLIDTGADRSLGFKKEDFEIILAQSTVIDSVNLKNLYLYDDTISPPHQPIYLVDKININGYILENIFIEEALEGTEPSIGIHFFNKFDSIIIDTKNKVFLFNNAFLR